MTARDNQGMKAGIKSSHHGPWSWATVVRQRKLQKEAMMQVGANLKSFPSYNYPLKLVGTI
jgi:hypothetical protein